MNTLVILRVCPIITSEKRPKVDNKWVWVYNTCIEFETQEKQMSALVEYTLELYKSDKRVKGGKRLVTKEDFAPVTRAYIKAVIESKTKLGFIVEAHETFVTKRNMMTGKTYQERYDTPYFCSPSSESFWSM